LHDDNLGSIETVTDAAGKLVEHLKYSPFGARRDSQNLSAPVHQPPTDVRQGFTGHKHDDEFGLINMQGRMYDPQIGRFLSADPVVGNPLSGQSYNRYSYVSNNPLTFTDPTGFDNADLGGEFTSTHPDESGRYPYTGYELLTPPGVPVPIYITGGGSDINTGGAGRKVADDQGNRTSPGQSPVTGTGYVVGSNLDLMRTPEQRAAAARFNIWAQILNKTDPLQINAASQQTSQFQNITSAKPLLTFATYEMYGSLGIFAALEAGAGGLLSKAVGAYDQAGIWLGARLITNFPRLAAILGLAALPSTEINTKVTETVVREAMQDASLQTMQKSVSLPRIQDYVTKLEEGEIPPPIKVDIGIIVDGNHRYIAGRIFGVEPSQIPWAGGDPSRVSDWENVFIDPNRWGN
jgi:RHS repeat-associated protein